MIILQSSIYSWRFLKNNPFCVKYSLFWFLKGSYFFHKIETILNSDWKWICKLYAFTCIHNIYKNKQKTKQKTPFYPASVITLMHLHTDMSLYLFIFSPSRGTWATGSALFRGPSRRTRPFFDYMGTNDIFGSFMSWLYFLYRFPIFCRCLTAKNEVLVVFHLYIITGNPCSSQWSALIKTKGQEKIISNYWEIKSEVYKNNSSG